MMETFDLRQIPDPQTRLDRYMDGMNGEIVSPEKVSWLFFDDFVQANDELIRWESRHPKDCFRISSNPIQLRISIPVDEKYNRIIHVKNTENRGYRK
ncbi:MAG: hypothetical protein ACYCUZ_05325 [Cuniculiplasma sp.]